ncbi:MAG TPA: hypothetical protein VF204_03105, partial [Streptosporangiaceae bacterium]
MLEAFGITTGAGLAAGELALAEMEGAGEEAAFGGAPELTRINVITTATAVTALPIIVQKSARPRCIGPPRRSCLSLGKRNILSIRWHWPTPTAFGPFWTVALRDQLRSIPPGRRARICAAVTCPAAADRLTRITCQALIRLVQRAAALTGVADDLEAQIAAIAGVMAPGLTAAGYGLGALTIAQILLSWSPTGRIRTEAAFAMLPGTARAAAVIFVAGSGTLSGTSDKPRCVQTAISP